MQSLKLKRKKSHEILFKQKPIEWKSKAFICANTIALNAEPKKLSNGRQTRRMMADEKEREREGIDNKKQHNNHTDE